MNYDYYNLVSEVQETNSLLETTNIYLENLVNISFVVGVLVLGCMCWRFLKSARK